MIAPRAERGRTPPVDYWVVVTRWDGEVVYEGPAPCPTDLCSVSAEDALAGRLYRFDMQPVGEVPRGLFISAAPTHWRWDRPHRPRRCLLCWVERAAVALGIARYEDDEPGVAVTVGDDG